MKMTEIRSLSKEKLVEQLETLRKEEMNLKFQKAAGQLEKPHRIAEVRKAIAQVKTEMTARKSGGNQ
ncbi:MAG: 50S ribosomal protein L29 [Proteobacteria bacterium]|jgi:large subunit ribosomal protein L29|nr:MAG: 50S ribosomal protein L29 [Pseudomonadota bacterium]|tara:strand:- start:965 stop:1165 length:201 start_codon:yes stop_codon:yes gene_type:complete